MTESYNPDPGVLPVHPYTTGLLSQRDLGLQIPVNFVTSVPGVSLTRACFAHDEYKDGDLALCMSNLLAANIRRFVIDLYWDQWRSTWSFCPVAIPLTIMNAVVSSDFSASTEFSLGPTVASMSSASLVLRQDSTAVASPSPLASNTTATSWESISPTVVSATNSPDNPLVVLGPYKCTGTVNALAIFSVVLDYIQRTETNLQAHILYMAINIHAAASSTSPTLPAPSPTVLPGPKELLGALSGNLSTYLYTPTNLKNNRADLNTSWYTVAERYRPMSGYYSTFKDANGILSTEDGWPTESYVEFSQGKRLIMSWGSVDPQMSDYNFSAEQGTIFSANYVQEYQTDITATAEGNVTDGCFFVDDSANVSKSNSSWAAVSTLPSLTYPANTTADVISLSQLTANLTRCGIAAVLNATLLNATAQEDFAPYRDFSYSTVWSWAPGEPKNTSSDVSDSLFRCAITKINSNGRWFVSDCSQKYYAACQAADQPYNWTLTTYQISYTYASQACGEGYVFAVPRTALENSYLTQAMRNDARNDGNSGVWVDFNSLNVKACWTTGGQNATCSYVVSNYLTRQTVIVPTVASVLLLVISALVVLVKASTNRQVRKRVSRRANNGFMYEGVPS